MRVRGSVDKSSRESALFPHASNTRLSDFDNHVYFCAAEANLGRNGYVYKVATKNANGPSSDPPEVINTLTFSSHDFSAYPFYDGVVRHIYSGSQHSQKRR